MKMQKVLDGIQSAVEKGIDNMDGREGKLTDQIIKLDIKLAEKRNERNMINTFLDKLHKIVAVIKE